jgi:hypothetical protein
LVRRERTSRKLEAVCSRVWYSSGCQSCNPKMWCRIQVKAIGVKEAVKTANFVYAIVGFLCIKLINRVYEN